MQGLDRDDRLMLASLQREGRITNLELSDRIGLSPTATSDLMTSPHEVAQADF